MISASSPPPLPRLASINVDDSDNAAFSIVDFLDQQFPTFTLTDANDAHTDSDADTGSHYTALLGQLTTIESMLTNKLSSLQHSHQQLAHSIAPLLDKHSALLSDYNVRMTLLQSHSDALTQSMADDSNHYQPFYQLLRSFVTSIQRIDRLIVYSELHQQIEQWSDAAKLTLANNQPLQAATTILSLARVHRQLIDEPAIRVSHLQSTLRHRLLYLTNQCKDQLLSLYRELLAELHWPQSSQSLLATDNRALVTKIEDLTETLTLLQLETNTHTSIEPQSLWVLQSMFRPFAEKFEFHFLNDLPTNNVDKPEWFLSFLLQQYKQHMPFLAQSIQPIVTKCGLMAVSVKNELLISFLQLVNTKLKNDLPLLIDRPQLFRHWINEFIQFESTIRGVDMALPDFIAGSLELFLDRAVFERWLKVDKDWVNDRLESLRQLDRPWKNVRDGSDSKVIGSDGNNEADDSDSEDVTSILHALSDTTIDTAIDAETSDAITDTATNTSTAGQQLIVTRSARLLMTLVSSIVDRFLLLPLLSARLRFLQDITYQLLDIYCEWLSEEGDSAIKSLRQCRASANDSEWYECALHYCGVANSCHYLITVLNDWNDQLPFIELHLYASLPHYFSDTTTAASVNEFVHRHRDNDKELLLDTGLFDPIISLYEAVREKLLVRVIGHVATTVETLTSEYRAMGHQWMIGQSPVHCTDGEDDRQALQRQLTEQLDVSPSLMPALLSVRLHLQVFHRSLSSSLFALLWSRLAVRLNDFFFHQCVRNRYFSMLGAQQFRYDMNALMLVFRGYTNTPQYYFQSLHDTNILLSLDDRQVREFQSMMLGTRVDLFTMSEEQRVQQWKSEFRIQKLSEQQIESVLQHSHQRHLMEPRTVSVQEATEVSDDAAMIGADENPSPSRSTSPTSPRPRSESMGSFNTPPPEAADAGMDLEDLEWKAAAEDEEASENSRETGEVSPPSARQGATDSALPSPAATKSVPPAAVDESMHEARSVSVDADASNDVDVDVDALGGWGIEE